MFTYYLLLAGANAVYTNPPIDMTSASFIIVPINTKEVVWLCTPSITAAALLQSRAAMRCHRYPASHERTPG